MSNAMPEIQEITASEVREYKGELYVESLSPNTIIYDGKSGEALRLTPQGSVGSLAFLPRDVALSPGFQRVWRRRMVRVVDQQSYELLSVSQESMHKREERSFRDKVESLMEPQPASRDLHPAKNSDGDLIFESGEQVKESGRETLKNDENFVSLGLVPIVLGADEQTGSDIVQNVQVTVTEPMKGN